MAGYDIGVSVAQSSAAKSGEVTLGDFILGGSGGAGKTPTWIWFALAGAGLLAVLFLFAFRK